MAPKTKCLSTTYRWKTPKSGEACNVCVSLLLWVTFPKLPLMRLLCFLLGAYFLIGLRAKCLYVCEVSAGLEYEVNLLIPTFYFGIQDNHTSPSLWSRIFLYVWLWPIQWSRWTCVSFGLKRCRPHMWFPTTVPREVQQGGASLSLGLSQEPHESELSISGCVMWVRKKPASFLITGTRGVFVTAV